MGTLLLSMRKLISTLLLSMRKLTGTLLLSMRKLIGTLLLSMPSPRSGCEIKVGHGSDTDTALMVSSSNKEQITSEADFISELPDEIICSIIMHLSIKEAVRTSILSRRWEKIWYSLPVFQLDWDNLFQAPPPLCGDRIKRNTSVPETSSNCKDRLLRMTNLFLDFCDHQSQRDGKELDMCLCFGPEYFQAVDLWVNLALGKKDVADISFKSFCCNCSRASQLKEYRPNDHIDRTSYYHYYQQQQQSKSKKVELQAANYNEDFPVLRGGGNRSQEDTFSKLRTLQLTGFTLGPNFFTYNNNNLRHLISLKLFHVQQLPSCVILLSALPDLQFLWLFYCGLADRALDLRPLLHLCSFRLWQCPGVGKVLVSSDNKSLQAFECHSFQLISCDLSCLPNIYWLLKHCVDGQGIHYTFKNSPVIHPRLVRLRIAASSNWVKMMPKDITTFCKVTRLELWFSNSFEFDTLKLISILKAFPILRSFELRIDDFGETQLAAAGCLEHIDYFPAHLNRVIIGGCIGPVHIQLAVFLIKQAAGTLRTLVFDKSIFDSRFDLFPMSWDEKERGEVCRRLKGLSEAKVVFVPQ